MPSKPSPGALVLNSFPYPHKMSLSATFASPKDAQVLCGTVSGEVMKGAWNHGTRFVSDAGMGTAMIAPDGSGTPAHKAFEEKWAYYCDRS